ncbi:MAG: methyl-accepting chemotaxis protein [Candidatus Acidiferrales bacterium]
MLKNLQMGTKLIGGSLLIALIAGAIGVTGIMNIRSLANADSAMYANNVVPLPQYGRILVNLQKLRVALRDNLAARNPEQHQKYEAQIDDLSNLLTRSVSEFDQSTLSPDQKTIMNNLQTSIKTYMQFPARVVAAAKSKKFDQGWDILWSPEYLASAAEVQAAIEKLQEMEIADGKTSMESNTALASSVTTRMILFVVIGLAIAIGAGIWVTHMITRPVREVVQVLDRLASGDLTCRVEVDSGDEIGRMGDALNRAISKIAATIQAVAENAQQVANASEEFSAVSQHISTNSEETSAQALVVSSATEQVNRNLQTVATGAEQMSSTIQDIAKNATESARVASEAVKTAETTNATVSKLGSSSAEIGQVIKVITSIAQQTNLLALNATIEAARAGEAGKGFAVVANEVKELAKQTAKATQDISHKIAAIQADTTGAVDAIATIGAIINQVNDISSTIATAVEEQSATTNEMRRNVAEAAKGSTEITQNITGVAQAAQGTSSSAHESMKAANQLAEMSTRLRGMVEQFKIGDAGTANGRKSRAIA